MASDYCKGCVYASNAHNIPMCNNCIHKIVCSPKCYNTNRCRVWREREKERRKK